MTSTFKPAGQRLKLYQHIDLAAYQVTLRRTMIALSDLKPVFIAETRLGCIEKLSIARRA